MRKKKSCEIYHRNFSCLKKKPWLNSKRGKILEKNSRKLSGKNIGSGWNTSGQKGGKICFGVVRLQTPRNSVSSNFIHSSHWIDGDTVHNRCTDTDNRDTRCRRGVPSTRPSACRQHERGIRNSRGKKEEEGRKTNPWGLRGVQTCPRPREIPKLSLRACWLAARFLADLLDPRPSLEAALWFSLESTQNRSRLISRTG